MSLEKRLVQKEIDSIVSAANKDLLVFVKQPKSNRHDQKSFINKSDREKNYFEYITKNRFLYGADSYDESQPKLYIKR